MRQWDKLSQREVSILSLNHKGINCQYSKDGAYLLVLCAQEDQRKLLVVDLHQNKLVAERALSFKANDLAWSGEASLVLVGEAGTLCVIGTE